MKKLLLIIDYQNDFVADTGSLTAGKAAQAIEKSLLKRIKAYQAAGDDILCTLDTHPAAGWTDQPEGRHFPLHCAEGSTGWKLYGKLADMDLETLTKASYMLDQTDIDWLVRQYEQIELAGVATDICVLQNAVGLYNHAANQGLKVAFTLSADCVAALDADKQQAALDYMKNILGFTIA
ncbi:MAG: isochorismatase family cysteine hydrolase [Clostridiaceae bacterium]|nr:isochorismatase family cysteine hydrolase [Clostridiaceae bacterium]